MGGGPGTTQRRVRQASGLALGLVVCAGAIATLAVLSMAVGVRPIAPSTVLDTLARFRIGPALSAGDIMAGVPASMAGDQDVVVILTQRLPRTILAILVGAALGLAGCVMQGLTRNPLADPGILGVNSGAALAVVLAMAALGAMSPAAYVWFAFLGAALAAILVYAVASLGRDGATPIKLALTGAALTTGFAAITSAFFLLQPAVFDRMRFWQVGAFAGRELTVVVQLAPFLVGGCLLALALYRVLNALALGDDVARGLGVRIGVARGLAAGAVVVLCGAATSAAGPIGFVGLTVPHAARAVTGPDYRWILPYSMAFGPILLLGADILGRLLGRPGEVQVAIVTALLGAPVFIALMRRRDVLSL